MAAPRSHTAADIFYGRPSSTSTSSPASQPPSAPRHNLVYPSCFPLPLFFLGGSRGSVHHRRGSLRSLGSEGASSRHCATYTTGQPPLHAATSYLHEKGETASSFSTPFHPPFPPAPDRAPLGAPSSVNTVHHYRQGAYISKGTALASLRLSPVTLDTILPPSSALPPHTVRAVYAWFRGEFFSNSSRLISTSSNHAAGGDSADGFRMILN